MNTTESPETYWSVRPVAPMPKSIGTPGDDPDKSRVRVRVARSFWFWSVATEGPVTRDFPVEGLTDPFVPSSPP